MKTIGRFVLGVCVAGLAWCEGVRADEFTPLGETELRKLFSVETEWRCPEWYKSTYHFNPDGTGYEEWMPSSRFVRNGKNWEIVTDPDRGGFIVHFDDHRLRVGRNAEDMLVLERSYPVARGKFWRLALPSQDPLAAAPAPKVTAPPPEKPAKTDEQLTEECAKLKPLWDIYKNNSEKIRTEFQPKFDELQKQYMKSLEALRSAVQSRGDLTKTKAAVAEIERFKKMKSLPPEQDEKEIEEIKAFQSTYVKQFTALEKDMLSKLGILTQKYEQALGRLQTDLVREGKLDEATAVSEAQERAKRTVADFAEQFAALAPAAPAEPAAAVKAAPAKTDAKDAATPKAAAQAKPTKSIQTWQCGSPIAEDVTATLRGNILTISGKGRLEGYGYGSGESAPWSELGVKSVVIEPGITSIGSRAFTKCRDLESVTIAEGVTAIGASAFAYGPKALRSVSFPNSLESIGDNAFNACGMTRVRIPDNVTSIGTGAFGQNHGLEEITVSASNACYSALDGVLYDKERTTLIQYPGGKRGAFVIPDGVTTIGRSAFCYCQGLTAVTIPASVTAIEQNAFWVWGPLDTVTNLNPVPQRIRSGVFTKEKLERITLIVPPGSLDAYKTAEGWKDLGKIREGKSNVKR